MNTDASHHEHPVPSPQASEVPSLASQRVLLVEDCPDQQRLYSAVLRRACFEVQLECNGEAAVRAVAASPAPFDLIVMDMVLPQLDGIAATRQIRELGFCGPILAITAHADEQVLRTWAEAGCTAYLTKPLAIVQFIDVALKLLYSGPKPLPLDVPLASPFPQPHGS